MVSKRTKTPWMKAEDFGRSLQGTGVNLLVSDISTTVAFSRSVLNAETVYDDEDFAVIRIAGDQFLLHADHTYSDHPYSASVSGPQDEVRGKGVELRVYQGIDPDVAQQSARDQGYVVLDGAVDKPHGLREVYILDPDGYCWVISRHPD